MDGLKVGMQGGGQFRQHLTDEGFTVSILYPDVKEKYVELFEYQHRKCASVPVDKTYK